MVIETHIYDNIVPENVPYPIEPTCYPLCRNIIAFDDYSKRSNANCRNLENEYLVVMVVFVMTLRLEVGGINRTLRERQTGENRQTGEEEFVDGTGRLCLYMYILGCMIVVIGVVLRVYHY